ncbi:MAG: hypothetical protein KDJ49_06060 [Alphaproteobacteria bacterium]|nr:hypothetical protein [Alphaproteobacteria bacterium]USO07990.1 MAG: hypothetical protein H6866_01855 [Rhodospirillales bacterium]
MFFQKNFRDRCTSAGRVVLRPSLLAALVLAATAVLGTSTLRDPLQTFVTQARDAGLAAGTALANPADPRALTRTALLRRVAGNADAVRDLNRAQFGVLFGPPDLRRIEAETESWHYVAPACALDVYFQRGALHPAYAEYRVRGDAQGARADADYHACLSQLYAQAGKEVPREHARVQADFRNFMLNSGYK